MTENNRTQAKKGSKKKRRMTIEAPSFESLSHTPISLASVTLLGQEMSATAPKNTIQKNAIPIEDLLQQKTKVSDNLAELIDTMQDTNKWTTPQQATPNPDPYTIPPLIPMAEDELPFEKQSFIPINLLEVEALSAAINIDTTATTPKTEPSVNHGGNYERTTTAAISSDAREQPQEDQARKQGRNDTTAVNKTTNLRQNRTGRSQNRTTSLCQRYLDPANSSFRPFRYQGRIYTSRSLISSKRQRQRAQPSGYRTVAHHDGLLCLYLHAKHNSESES